MNLIVHELGASRLTQEIRTPADENIFISAVRPHLYKHLAPAGSLRMLILDVNERVIAVSNTVAISSISVANYFHGYIRFDISAGLRKNTVYHLALEGVGYTFSESAYIGWCNGFDLAKYEVDYSPAGGFAAPLDYEIWKRIEPAKGAY